MVADSACSALSSGTLSKKRFKKGSIIEQPLCGNTWFVRRTPGHVKWTIVTTIPGLRVWQPTTVQDTPSVHCVRRRDHSEGSFEGWLNTLDVSFFGQLVREPVTLTWPTRKSSETYHCIPITVSASSRLVSESSFFSLRTQRRAASPAAAHMLFPYINI